MKKSNKNYIALFIAAITILIACKKTFLDVQPVGGTALEV